MDGLANSAGSPRLSAFTKTGMVRGDASGEPAAREALGVPPPNDPGKDANRERWRNVSIEDRMTAFGDMWIETPKLSSLLQLIPAKIEYTRVTRTFETILVLCESGGGKSHLCRHLAKLYPNEEADAKTIRRFVQMKIPKPCTNATLAKALLFGLGDPAWDSGAASKNLIRAIQLLKKCETHILAVDNFQDIPERRDKRGVRVIGNWFRDLLDQTCLLFLPLGTKEAEEVRLGNDQMKRRVMTKVRLPYFSLKTQADRLAWKKCLNLLDAQLPLSERSDLTGKALAGRLFVACNGIFDYLSKLLTRAVYVAAKRGAEKIELPDLDSAFSFLHGDVEDKANPFKLEFKVHALTEEDEPFFKPEPAGTRTPSDPGRKVDQCT